MNNMQLLQARKQAIMPLEHYDMLADRVLSRNAFFGDGAFSPSVWDDVVGYAYSIMQHTAPDLYISTVKNELRQKYKSVSAITIGSQRFRREDYRLIAFKLYVLLRYRFGQDKRYLEYALPSLYEIIDNVNKTVLFGNGYNLHTLFQRLRPYKPATLKDVAAQAQQEYAATQPAPAAAQPATAATPPLRVRGKHKTDIIKVLYAMAGQGWFERADGHEATIGEIMSFFGEKLSEEGITNYSPSFSKAKNGTQQTFLKPFTLMETFMRKYYNAHNS